MCSFVDKRPAFVSDTKLAQISMLLMFGLQCN